MHQHDYVYYTAAELEECNITGCTEAPGGIWMLLDPQHSRAQVTQMKQHLNECRTCIDHLQLEQRVRALISRTCSGDKIPEHLREKVRLEISRTTIIRHS